MNVDEPPRRGRYLLRHGRRTRPVGGVPGRGAAYTHPPHDRSGRRHPGVGGHRAELPGGLRRPRGRVRRRGLPAEFEALFESAGERIYGEQARLLDGTHDLLSTLATEGAALPLTTSSPHAWIALVDERFGLTRHFDAVVSADDVDGPGKPAPGIYERGAAELGGPPAACVAVEDSAAGVRAAVDAGLYTVGFRGDGDEADLSAADETVTGIKEPRAALLDG